MTRTWPTDNLLDDAANEFAELLYPNWDFSKYGIRNPWAFRLACRDSLRITDDGEVFIEPDRLIENLDYYMTIEAREKEGCLDEDRPYPDEKTLIENAVESMILDALNESDLTDSEIDRLIGKRDSMKDLIVHYTHKVKSNMLMDFNMIHRIENGKA